MNALGVLAREEALRHAQRENWERQAMDRRIDDLQARKSAAHQALEKEVAILRVENAFLRQELSDIREDAEDRRWQ